MGSQTLSRGHPPPSWLARESSSAPLVQLLFAQHSSARALGSRTLWTKAAKHCPVPGMAPGLGHLPPLWAAWARGSAFSFQSISLPWGLHLPFSVPNHPSLSSFLFSIPLRGAGTIPGLGAWGECEALPAGTCCRSFCTSPFSEALHQPSADQHLPEQPAPPAAGLGEWVGATPGVPP